MWPRSWTATTPVKYKRDIQQLTYVLAIVKNSENNGTEEISLVTPTPERHEIDINATSFGPASQCRYRTLLSGVPDYFGRNKISSGGDLSHHSSASLYYSFLVFCLICVYQSHFSISLWIMYLL